MKPSFQTLALFIIIILTALPSSINGDNNDLDQETTNTVPPPIPDPSIKCGSCPCINPCMLPPVPSPPPPSPPPPPPPPLPSPSPPPPPRPPVQYCPPAVVVVKPPPPPRFIYVTSPPSSVYHPFPLRVYSGGGGGGGGGRRFTGWAVVVGWVVLEWWLV